MIDNEILQLDSSLVEGRQAIQTASLAESLSNSGSRIVVIGEVHTSEEHRLFESELLKELINNGFNTLLLEGFPYGATLVPREAGEDTEDRLNDFIQKYFPTINAGFLELIRQAYTSGLAVQGIDLDESRIAAEVPDLAELGFNEEIETIMSQLAGLPERLANEPTEEDLQLFNTLTQKFNNITARLKAFGDHFDSVTSEFLLKERDVAFSQNSREIVQSDPTKRAVMVIGRNHANPSREDSTISLLASELQTSLVILLKEGEDPVDQLLKQGTMASYSNVATLVKP